MANSILIIENNRSIAQDLRKRLKAFGYEVVGICTSDNDVLQSIKTLSPDMIIMNIRLQKGNDGIRTGELVRLEYGVPVIYMTEFVGQATLRRAKSTGPFGYIFIPFTDKQIITTLEIASLRNQFELEIQESQRWLSGILNSIADGVVAINNDGQIRYINPVAQSLTGWHESTAIGRSIADVITLLEELNGQSIDLWSEPGLMVESRAEHAFEAILLTLEGRHIPVEVNMSRITGSTPATSGMVIAFRDIRKQRESLHEIQRQAERAQALVKTAEQLNSNLELSHVLNTICRLTNHAIKAAGSAVFLFDNKKSVYFNVSAISELEHFRNYGENQFRIPAELVHSFLSQAIPVAVLKDLHDRHDLPYMQLFHKEDIHTMVMAGIFQRQELMGFLASIFVHEPKVLQQADLELLKGLADQAATSITNAKLFRQVRLGREQQRKLAKTIVDIQEEERRHLARELHDHLGQVLTGLQFMLKNAKKQDGMEQQTSLEEMQKTVGDAIGRVREMSLNLRPAMLDDMGLFPTLQWHIERYTTQTGIRVNFHCDKLAERLPPDVETTAYRIVQEALTNVARHAGVTEVFVGLIAQDDVLWIEVLDQGRGFDVPASTGKPTAGLSGMRERASLIGGYAIIQSFIDQGTQVVVALPLAGKPLERRKFDRHNPAGR